MVPKHCLEKHELAKAKTVPESVLIINQHRRSQASVQYYDLTPSYSLV